MDQLKEHPQIVELLDTLDKNGLMKEKNEVQSLVSYIGGMEETLTEMLGELQDTRREINLIHNNTLRSNGFNSRVEWCACFVSWCANECGYIDAGVIPKYAGCVNGVQWFKDRGQWLDNSAEPTPGMIIFFDWADESGQDGLSDHTGIVQKVENGRVYTVEGNSGDSVRQNSYPVGYYEILGYGAPAY